MNATVADIAPDACEGYPGGSIVMLSVAAIGVETGRRPLREDAIEKLMKSIEQVGLLNPITVTTAPHRLVAGAHRLESCKRLEWALIECRVVDLDDLMRELAEIDENFCRAELTALERGELTVRRKRIYEDLYPETRHGGDRSKEQVAESATCQPGRRKSFVGDTADKTGKSQRAIRQDVQIGNDIASDVKEQLATTPLADRKTDLIALSQMEEERQREVAAVVTKGAKTLDEALRILGEASVEERKQRAVEMRRQNASATYEEMQAATNLSQSQVYAALKAAGLIAEEVAEAPLNDSPAPDEAAIPPPPAPPPEAAPAPESSPAPEVSPLAALPCGAETEGLPSIPPSASGEGNTPEDTRAPIESLEVRTTEKGNSIAAGRILYRESAINMAKHYSHSEIAAHLKIKVETVTGYLHVDRPEQFIPPEQRGHFDPEAAARESRELSREPWVTALLQHLRHIQGAHDLGLQKVFQKDLGGAKDAINQAADILKPLIAKLENYEEEGIC